MEIFNNLTIGSLSGTAAAAVLGAIVITVLVVLIVVIVNAIRAIKERNEVEADARANRYYANYGRTDQNAAARRSELTSRQNLPVVPYQNPANSRRGAQSTNVDVAYMPPVAEDNEIVTLPPDPTMGMGMYPGMYPPPMMGGYMPPMPPMMPYNPYMPYPMQQPEEIYHLPEMLERDEVYTLPDFVDPLAAPAAQVERPDRSDDIKSILEAMQKTEEELKAEEQAEELEEVEPEKTEEVVEEEKVEETAPVHIAPALPDDEEIVTLEDAHGNRAEYIRVCSKPDRTDDISILMHAGDIPMREVVQEVKEEVSVAPAAEEETAPAEQHVVDNSERPDRKDDIFVLMHMNDHAEEQAETKEEAPAFAAGELADNPDDDEIVELEFAEEPVAKEVKEEPAQEEAKEEAVAEAASEETEEKAQEPVEETPAEEAKEEKEEEPVAKYYEDNAPRPDRNDDIFLLMGLSGKHEDEKEEAAQTAAEEAPAEQPVAAAAAEEENEGAHDQVQEETAHDSSSEDNDETNNNNKKTAVVLAALGAGGEHDSEACAEETVACDDDEEIVELEEYVSAEVEEEEPAVAKRDEGERPDRKDDIVLLMHANDKVEEPVVEETPAVVEEVAEAAQEPEETEPVVAEEKVYPNRAEDISMLMQPETEDEENEIVELEDIEEEPAAEVAEEPEEEQAEEPAEEPEEEPAEEPESEQEPAEEEPSEEQPEEEQPEEPAKPEGVLLKREEDWSNYDGDFDGYYYDPNDGCYYEGEPSDELKDKLEAKKRAHEAANDNTRKKVNVKKVKPLFMPLSTPKNDRKSPEKPQRGFDDSSIYGKYVIEHASTSEGGKEYFFTLYDPSDECLYESDNFTSLENCKKAINRFKVHVQSGTLTVAAEDGKYLYQLVTEHFTYKGLPKPNFEDADATIEQVLDYYATPIVREQ